MADRGPTCEGNPVMNTFFAVQLKPCTARNHVVTRVDADAAKRPPRVSCQTLQSFRVNGSSMVSIKKRLDLLLPGKRNLA